MKNQSSASAASWEKTNVPDLYRHPKGVYYARYRVGKQDVWRSLRTKVKSVAVYDLSKVLDAVRRGSGLTGGEGPMRFKDASDLRGPTGRQFQINREYETSPLKWNQTVGEKLAGIGRDVGAQDHQQTDSSLV
jgi:hypothetical protein